MARAWPAREIVTAAQRLAAERRSEIALALGVLDVQSHVEEIELPADLLQDAKTRMQHGMPALPDRWTPSRQWPDHFRALRTRIHDVLVRATMTRDVGSQWQRAVSADATTRAFFRAVAISLVSLVEDECWLRARCPICGSAPDLASIGDRGDRRLLCARCDTEWAYMRIACPFCGTEDHEDLGYHPAGDGSYRVYVCGVCSRYLKAVDLRSRTDACLPLERWLTRGLDAAALAAGYAGG